MCQFESKVYISAMLTNNWKAKIVGVTRCKSHQNPLVKTADIIYSAHARGFLFDKVLFPCLSVVLIEY